MLLAPHNIVMYMNDIMPNGMEITFSFYFLLRDGFAQGYTYKP